MLYDKKWEQQASLVGFIAWLRTKNPNEEMNGAIQKIVHVLNTSRHYHKATTYGAHPYHNNSIC